VHLAEVGPTWIVLAGHIVALQITEVAEVVTSKELEATDCLRLLPHMNLI
jgi:hypothetical protein